MFRKHGSHLSEIFLVGLERILATNSYILTFGFTPECMTRRAGLYGDAIQRKTKRPSNPVGFIDDTDIGIVRRSGIHMMQLVACNGH